jgi:2-polyprenyl-3-methyl-5-hydroxy-6-metoxy-1,4-benzoquinol methylase
MVTYDKYYQKENYFGHPYPGLIEFFKTHQLGRNILDLGCGQGRNALALARLGYSVVGVDLSKVGIDQMMTTAKKENLDVKGIIGDINRFPISNKYDIILLDSMLHFYKKDREKEISLLKKLMKEVKTNGLLIILMNKSKSGENSLEKVFNDSKLVWNVIEDKYTDYPDFNAIFRMYAVEKKGVSNF